MNLKQSVRVGKRMFGICREQIRFFTPMFLCLDTELNCFIRDKAETEFKNLFDFGQFRHPEYGISSVKYSLNIKY